MVPRAIRGGTPPDAAHVSPLQDRLREHYLPGGQQLADRAMQLTEP